MTDTASARFALPLLEPGQAQKEMFHNEAIAAIDLIVQACAMGGEADTPPPAPAIGQCWIVGTVPAGAWAGRPRRLAGWTGGGWRFVDPTEGMAVWVAGDKLVARFVDGEWTSGSAIPDPAGGASIDAEARAAIAAILATLRSQGLIAG